MKMNLRAAIAAAGIVFASGVIVLNAQNPAPDEVRMSSHPFLAGAIAVKTTLVEVDTVVRDDDGRSVAGLTADDFAITDNGKPQKVSGFTVQKLAQADATSQAAASVGSSSAGRADAPAAEPTTNPARYVAMFFDDLHTDHGDMEHARKAALGFMNRGFEPGDHVGVFTASNIDTLDFTEDKDKINEALGKIAPHLRMSLNGDDGCLKMTPYMAYVITNNLDPEETLVLLPAAIRCHCSEDDFKGGAMDSCATGEDRQYRGLRRQPGQERECNRSLLFRA